LINSRLQGEKIERDGKQESCRLQTELNLLRKRLEQTDEDYRKSQDLIVHLNETISELQRDASLAKIRLEGHLNLNAEEVGDVSSIIHAMEDKQSAIINMHGLPSLLTFLVTRLTCVGRRGE